MDMDKEFFVKLYDISLNHKVQFNPDSDMNEIKTYIEAIGQGNGYYPDKVLSMIEKIDKIIPRVYYNAGNPNNGNRLWEIDIGREYSPVIYITIKTRSLGKDLIDPQTIPAIINDCKSAAERAKADEIGYEIDNAENDHYGYREINLRFWWD